VKRYLKRIPATNPEAKFELKTPKLRSFPEQRGVAYFDPRICNPHVNSRCRNTRIYSALCRMAAKRPDLDYILIGKLRGYVRVWIRRTLSRCSSDALPDTFKGRMEWWLARSHYSEKDKERLRSVYQRNASWLESEGWGSRRMRGLIKALKAFIKDEYYLEYKPGRGIYARCDLAKLVFGPYIKLIESVVFDLKYFIKHTQVRERPALIKERVESSAETTMLLITHRLNGPSVRRS